MVAVSEIADVMRRIMEELSLRGEFDVSSGEERQVGWVGPGPVNDDDIQLLLTIRPLREVALAPA